MEPDRLAAMRRDYAARGLEESDLAADPITQFGYWLAAAVAAELVEPNAMVVSTVSPNGQPSSRTVLLKHVDPAGFVFHTNYGSAKAREMAANPRVSLLFPWHPITRQVIVAGRAERVGPEETAAYFRTRPRVSQLSAWASRQSEVIANRRVLEERLARVTARYPDGTPVPVPSFWGGIRVVPATVEFWQGRPGRLHDRFRYQRDGHGWAVQRLSP